MTFLEFIEGSRTHTPEIVIVMRLILAAVLGALIGLDRELKDKPAGLRTHMLTSLAAALFSVLTIEIFEQTQSGSNQASSDPIRVVEAVTAGVAFLAAGAIIRSGRNIHGLTTGAGMWLAGAIGLACGLGLYSIATMTMILAVLIITVLQRLEDRAISHANARTSKTKSD